MNGYNSNISLVVGVMKSKLISLEQNPDQMLRTVAFAVLPEVKKRVHIDGKASNGEQIGTYSPEYMKIRTGNFGNSAKFSKGKHKGSVKDSGTFSRGKNKGEQRPRYNRTGDTRVIASLTRQMENDMSVLATGSGYGIGYNNPDNFNKSQFVESTYKKDIWSLTTDEKELATATAQQFVNDFLSKE